MKVTSSKSSEWRQSPYPVKQSSIEGERKYDEAFAYLTDDQRALQWFLKDLKGMCERRGAEFVMDLSRLAPRFVFARKNLSYAPLCDIGCEFVSFDGHGPNVGIKRMHWSMNDKADKEYYHSMTTASLKSPEIKEGDGLGEGQELKQKPSLSAEEYPFLLHMSGLPFKSGIRKCVETVDWCIDYSDKNKFDSNHSEVTLVILRKFDVYYDRITQTFDALWYCELYGKRQDSKYNKCEKK